MTRTWSAYLRRGLLVVFALALIWAVAVALTGGFVVRLGPVRVSSRSPRNVVLIALLSGAAAWWLWSRRSAGTTPQSEWSWWRSSGLSAVASVRTLARQLVRESATVITLVGIGLGIHLWAGALPMWVDEEMIALNVRDRSFAGLAGPMWLGQSAPFGWLIAQRAVILMLGSSELAMRLIPLLFGIATLAAAWWIGRRWMTRAGAAVLTLLIVFGQFVSHYRFQVKHYSADTFAGLLLPALAVWASEAETGTDRVRRLAVWWGAAALAQWFANGAMLATPACAVWLFIVTVRRGGTRATLAFISAGALWLVLFGLHYQVSLRDTHQSRYLRTYWAAEVPPADAGVAGAVRWVADRFEPLARDPGGTELALSLWLCAGAGFAIGSRRALGAVFALMPLSAFVLAVLRLVPLYERFSLWIAPALYVGIALLIDRAARSGRQAWLQRSWPRLAVATVVAIVALRLCAAIVYRGSQDVLVTAPRNVHRVDDRAAVRWLMARRQPGDAVMATRLGWPAMWWYGGISIADEHALGVRKPDGSAMYEMAHMPHRTDCRRQPLREALKNHPRVLVYLGFPDVPGGFESLLLDNLAELGAITEFAEFTELSVAAVVDLRVADSGNKMLIQLRRKTRVDPRYPPGCVGARPARRW